MTFERKLSASENRRRLSELAGLDMTGHCTAIVKDLKDAGVEPGVVYDIGACVGQWTKLARTAWPSSKYVLFEAYEPAAFLFSGEERFVGVLGSRDNEIVKFYQSEEAITGNSYYKERNDEIFPEGSYVERATRSLDSVVESYGFPAPDLIKIDVQGSELDILRGAAKTLESAKALVVEMQGIHYNEGAPLVTETKPIIESMGWKFFGKYDDDGNDADYVFVRP
jgi:FkbM family methyltransferase